jgi:hypothetical protein
MSAQRPGGPRRLISATQVIGVVGSGRLTTMSDHNVLTKLRSWPQRQAEAYRNGADRPLGGYLKTMAMYAAGTVGAALAARATGRTAPRLSPWDVAQLAVATHKVSRLIAKDPVTSPLRAPFTRYEGVSAPSELAEEVRGTDLQHSLGELVSCPMCLAQWVATGFGFGLVFAPAPTRLALSAFTAVAGADFLQYAYVRMQQATE